MRRLQNGVEDVVHGEGLEDCVDTWIENSHLKGRQEEWGVYVFSACIVPKHRIDDTKLDLRDTRILAIICIEHEVKARLVDESRLSDILKTRVVRCALRWCNVNLESALNLISCSDCVNDVLNFDCGA